MRGRITAIALFVMLLFMISSIPDSPFELLPKSAKADATPLMYINPPAIINQSAGAGEYYQVTVNISNVPSPGMWGFEFYLTWNGTVQNVTVAAQGSGAMLPKGGSVYFSAKKYNEPLNYVYVTATLMGTPYVNAFPQTGSGGLCYIKFLVENTGSTALHLYSTELYTLGPPPTYSVITMDHTTQDGYFSNLNEVHDLAVVEVALSSNEVLQGQNLTINVKIQNKGNRAETCALNIYYNTSLIKTQTGISVAIGVNVTRTVYWNTSSATPGPYFINATVPRVTGELDISNNSRSSSIVTVYNVHDVTVTVVTLLNSTIWYTQKTNITVVVKNTGKNTETFNVTVYYGSNVLAVKNVNNLAPAASNNLVYIFSSSGISSGSYQIQAVATPVPGETHTSDNTVPDGTLTIKVADANVDSVVNVIDLAILGRAYGASSGNSRYDSRADFNKDNVVDYRDLNLLALSWGYGG
jgi:hypothetical protein